MKSRTNERTKGWERASPRCSPKVSDVTGGTSPVLRSREGNGRYAASQSSKRAARCGPKTADSPWSLVKNSKRWERLTVRHPPGKPLAVSRCRAERERTRGVILASTAELQCCFPSRTRSHFAYLSNKKLGTSSVIHAYTRGKSSSADPADVFWYSFVAFNVKFVRC